MAENCVISSLYTFETYGGLVFEVLAIIGLFYAMMVLTDEFLMGSA